MYSKWFENLESRRLCSASAGDVIAPVSHAATGTTIVPAKGKFKGTTVSSQGFSTRLTMTLGKERVGGTIIGTFDYLDGFKFVMHLRVASNNTFHGTIATGALAGTLTHGIISTASHGTIIDLSGTYTFSNGKGDADSGTFLARD